jgi:hypothetical protein
MNFLLESVQELRSRLRKSFTGERTSRPTKNNPVSQGRQLSLEQLEDRQLMSVTYHGGPLLRNVEVATYFLGQAWNYGSAYQQTGAIDGYMDSITNSTYLDMLTQAGYRVGRGQTSNGYIFNWNVVGSIDDSQIQKDLESAIYYGQTPAPDANRLYFVFTPPNVEVTAGSENSHSSFAGYHSWFFDPFDGQEIHYAVIPYPGGINYQNSNLGNPIDQITDVSSHELAEAVTDPEGTGWYDGDLAHEIGDIVAWQTVYFGGWVVQKEANQNDQPMTPAGATVTPLQANGDSITAIAGQTFNGTVGTFTDNYWNSGNLTAYISWGDGNTSIGQIVNNGNGTFSVLGSTTYLESGQYTIIIQIADSAGNSTNAYGAATVNQPPLPPNAYGTSFSTTAGKSFTGVVANFTDSDPYAQANSYTVTITWGDGHTSSGQVYSSGYGSFTVYGSNTYAQGGSYTVTVQISDSDGTSATAFSKASITLGTGIVGEVNGQWWVGLSTGSGFSTALWGALDPNVRWVDVQTGDFNGDGQTDIIARDSQTGNWWVGLSNGSSFVTTIWSTWNPNVTWVDLQIGDFTGDGKDDIAARVAQTGQWWVGMSTGSSFVNSLWTTWNPNVAWVDVQSGDFNGDGKADIAGRVLQTGQWWVAQSAGSYFTNSLWTTWSPNVTWVDVHVGDFNGDGKADIIGRVLQTGQWWVAQSTGFSFANSLWATWSPYVTWVDLHVGDFNGDGKADIIGRVLQSGQWWVGTSNGSNGFNTNLWATWSPAVNWVDVQIVDLNGDGFADITARDSQSGNWWTGLSNGYGFSTSYWGAWSSAVSWTGVHEGTFVNGAGRNLGGRG